MDMAIALCSIFACFFRGGGNERLLCFRLRQLMVQVTIIVWNTVYIDKVVQQLRQEGHSINDEDLKHIWPTRHAHINVYGQYHFDRQRFGKNHPLRSLRNPPLNP